MENKLSSDDAVRLYKETNTSNENKSKGSTKKAPEQKKLVSKSSERLVKNDKSNNNTNKSKQKQNNNNKKETHPKKSSIQTKPINDKVLDEIKNDEKKTEIVENDLDEQLQQSIVTDTTRNHSSDENETKYSYKSNLNVSEKDVEEAEALHNHINSNENLHLSQDAPNESVDVENNDNVRSKAVEIDSNTENISTFINNKEQSIIRQDPEPLLENEINKKENDSEKKINVEKEIKVTNSSSTNRPKSVRPSSSRPSAPRLKEKHDTLVSTGDNLVIGKVNVIAESITQEEVFF